MKDGKQMERAVGQHPSNLRQSVGITGHVVTKSLLCLEKCQKVCDPKCRDPRPALAKFANLRHREMFSASANRIKTTTRCEIIIQLDDTAITMIKARTAMGEQQDSIHCDCMSPNCESISSAKEEN